MEEPSQEAMTVAGAVELLQRRGFTASFEPADGRLTVRGRERAYGPEELTIREYYRLEGVSDPDDLAVVYGLEAADGTRGVLVDAFGPYADPRVAAVLRAVEVRAPSRDDSPAPRTRPQDPARRSAA